MSWWLVLNQTLFISNSGNVTAVRSDNPIFEGFLQISHGYLSDEFSFCQPMKCTRRLKFSGRSKTEYSWHGICMSYKLVCVLRGQGTRPRKTRKKDKNYFFKRIGYSVTSLFIFWVFNIEYWFISYNRILKIRRKFLDLLKLGYNEPRRYLLRGSLAVLYVIPNTASYESDIYIQLKDHVCCSNSYIGSKRMVKMKQCRRMASHFMRNTVADTGSALTDARSLRTV